MAPACDVTGPPTLRPIWIPHRVVLVGIPMWPAINRDSFNVACRVKTTRAYYTGKLVAYISLEGIERCSQQLIMTGSLLVSCGEARLAGSTQHAYQDRLVRRLWRFVITDVNRLIQTNGGVIHARTGDAPDSELVERSPATEGHDCVNQRHLDPIVQGFFLFGRKLRTKIGNNHIPAGQHSSLPANAVCLLLAAVYNFDLLCRTSIAQMSDLNGGAVQTHADGGICTIETAVVHLRRDDVLCRAPRSRTGNQGTYQHAGDRCIAVREMKVVLLLRSNLSQCGEAQAFRRNASQTHSLESGKVNSPAIQGWNGINADSIQPVRVRLVERNDFGMSFHGIEQEIFIAHLREACLLLRLGHSWHVVDACLLNADNVLLRLRGERRPREKLRPFTRPALAAIETAWRISYQPLGSKSLFIEEVSEAEVGIGFAIGVFLFQCRGIDAQFGKQPTCFPAVRKWRLDSNGSAVGQQHSPVEVEFVALSVSAKIVVIVENQNAGGRSGMLPVEIGRGKAADPATDNDQVILFSGLHGLACFFPEAAVAQGMRYFKRTGMAASHAGEGRRIVAGAI